MTFRAGDELEVPVEVRHHGAKDLGEGEWIWRITDQDGKEIDRGTLGKNDVPTGTLTAIGTIRMTLPELKQPEELTLRIWMESSNVENEWPIWVYPAIEQLETPGDVMISGEWTPEVIDRLQSGGRVLLTPLKDDTREPVDIHFGTVDWGRGLFPSLPRPMGIYCNPAHPALSQFPTREYAGWQWYDLLTDAYALTLNDLPFEYEPVVHIIDDFNESHRLGVLIEASVGEGSLLISTLNLGRDGERSLAQQQMLKSLLNYASADDFIPEQILTFKQLEGIWAYQSEYSIK